MGTGDFSTPLEMTGATWGRCVPPQQETFYAKNPAGHEIHSCPAGYFLFLIVYENPLGCFVAQRNVSFRCFQKDGAFVGFFFLDFDFHVNVDAPALEVVPDGCRLFGGWDLRGGSGWGGSGNLPVFQKEYH